MTSLPIKATEVLEKPPAAKPLRSRWLPEDDPKLTVNRVNGIQKSSYVVRKIPN